MPTSLLANTEIVQAGFQILMSSPQLQAEYALGPLFSHMMSAAGMRGLAKFQLPPDQAAAQRERLAAEAAEAEGGGPTGGNQGG